MRDLSLNLSKEMFFCLNMARDLCYNFEQDYISDVPVFSCISMMKNSKFHRGMINRGISTEKITTVSYDILMKYNEDEFDDLYQYPVELSEDSKDIFIINHKLYDIFQRAYEIGKDLYGENNISCENFIIAFGEIEEKIYENFMWGVGLLTYQPEIDTVIPNDLADFLFIMNDKYSVEEKICPICGRDSEMEELICILSKKTKKNAILVGEPGVGKTALVEKLTWQIATGNCIDKFKNTKIIQLDVNAIVAGTVYRGMAEQRFQELIWFLEKNPNCILFIDEIHTILGAGACKDGELDLANALKPILARGETQVIGATTLNEYEKYFSEDGALKRRFEKIKIREPRTKELYDMIKNQIILLEKFHNTKISKELVDSVILNASCFNYETKNPDRTLDLLDRAMACAELKGKKKVEQEDILKNFAIRRRQFEKMSEERKKAIAYHEAGHFIVQRFSPELAGYTTLAISIMPAEQYLGVNVYEEDEDIIHWETREYYIALIARALSGRRAEAIYTGKFSAGASADLENATKIAQDMVTRYGLEESFTQDRVYLRESRNSIYTESTNDKINREIDKILLEARTYADKILKEHRKELELLVEKLLEKGILSKNDIDDIFD